MSNWSTAICETNRINMHYTRTGGNKPPVILLHGLTGDGACWTPVARALEGEYDVIMPDARCHGKSSVPTNGYRYEDLANDVEGLIGALELSPPIVIGHSMGGMTGALVAFRKQKLLRSLILADPSFLSPEIQREVYEGAVEQHKRLLNKSLDEVLTEARAKHPHRPLDTLKLIIRARHQTTTIPFRVLMPPTPHYKQLVSAIDVPSLLVITDKGGVVSPAVAEELQSTNPKLQVEKITEAGHGLHYDQPEQFVAIVKSFLRAI